MTKEEAKEYILECLERGEAEEIIKAFEQEPCETQMIDKSNYSQEQYKADLQSAYDCGKASVKSCEDAISRTDLIDKLEIIDKGYGSDFYWEVRKIVDSLPPVKPVACIAKVTFNKEDMQRIVDEEVNKITIELDTILDKIEDEVAQTDFDFGDYYDNTESIIEMVCNIIDKYKMKVEE